MNESAIIAMEITFNILYLILIYALVIMMYRRYRSGSKGNGNAPFLLAFLLLAIGDTGHVGFRIAAFVLGGLEVNEQLVGLGALATAITVTFFYMLMAQVLRARSGKRKNHVFLTVVILGVIRLVFMILPGNNWGQIVPPMGFSYGRNSFLTAMGIIVAVSFLQAASHELRSLYRAAAVCVFISFAFYIPVILFIRSVPMLGMLMIPKTLAYVALAVIGYRKLFSIGAVATDPANSD